MKKAAASLLITIAALTTSHRAEAGVAIIPKPANITLYENTPSFTLPEKVSVKTGRNVPSYAYTDFSKIFGKNGITTIKGGNHPTLTITLNPQLSDEAYTLDINSDGINVSASGRAGFFYAAQTLDQIIRQSQDHRLETMSISDSPRFPYRGFMIDVTRCYQPVDSLKKLIDEAARLKLNNVHLHLTDDNGWRLEIKKYPKLTEVGAWRVDRPEIFPARRNPVRGEETTYGGFYTQKEMRDLVKYASERNVNIIPEIEMPAHSVAALASYPELACQVGTSFIGVLPGIGGYNARIIACAGNENTFKFYEDVLTEVMDIFPSKMIHLGGDEAHKERWKKCELCNRRLAEEGLADYEELQGYFMDRINRFVRSKGRTAIGWDEVTYGKPKEDIVVMGWQGDGFVATKYARQTGRNIIMTPAQKMYLIRYQGPQWFEPFTYFGNVTLKNVYDYEPFRPDWTPEMKEQLLGIQASMWTEFCRTPSDVQYMVFPRLIAAADAAWRPEGQSDWPYFLKALDSYTPTLDKSGIKWARSMFNLDHKVTPDPAESGVKIELSSIRPDLEIRWWKSPEATAGEVYAEPIKVTKNTTVHAAAFSGGKQIGQTLTLPIHFNKATGAQVKASDCLNGLADRLTNGLRGSDRNSDFEWAGWYNEVVKFTIDLGSIQPVNNITIGNLANINLCIAAPSEIFVYTSKDNLVFHEAGRIVPTKDQIYPLESTVTDFNITFPLTDARYVRVVAVNPGAVPDGLPREGTPTWIYFDEVIVN